MMNKACLTLRRRDFLTFSGSTGILLAGMVSGLQARPKQVGPWPPTDTPAAELFAMGYVQGSGARTLTDSPLSCYGLADVPADRSQASRNLKLMAAEALLEGDPRFARDGVRLAIYGMVSHDDLGRWADVASLAIDVNFEPFHANVFHAWAFRNDPVPCISSSGTCRVPVADALRLTLAVAQPVAAARPTTPAAEPEASWTQQASIRLTLGREPRQPKLQRGLYVIALRHTPTPLRPAWRACRLQAASSDGPNALPTLWQWDPHRQQMVRAAAIMLSVDYA